MELSSEVHFAQRLANNELKIREKTLQKLGRWLASKSANKECKHVCFCSCYFY